MKKTFLLLLLLLPFFSMATELENLGHFDSLISIEIPSIDTLIKGRAIGTNDEISGSNIFDEVSGSETIEVQTDVIRMSNGNTIVKEEHQKTVWLLLGLFREPDRH